MRGEEADRGAESLSSGNGYPELRFKPGYQNPRNAPVQVTKPEEAPPQEESHAMSIEDMLAATQRANLQPAPSKPVVAPPPPEPEPIVQLPEEPLLSEAVATFVPTEDIVVDGAARTFGPDALPQKPPNYTPPREPRIDPDRLKKGIMLVAAVALLAVLPSALSGLYTRLMPTYELEVKSEPRAELFKGEERVGRTPQTIKVHAGEEGYTLRVAGYKTKPLLIPEELKPDQTNEVFATLEGEPVALDWNGFPQNTRIWWDKKELNPKDLSQAPAGSHKVKVKTSNGMVLEWTINIPWHGSDVYPVGQAVSNELARRPQLKLTLSGASQTSATVKNDSGFSQQVKLDKGSPVHLALPGPGKYSIKASTDGLNYQESLTLKEGQRSSLAVALTAPVSSGGGYSGGTGGGGGGYTPPPRSYSPPPSYSGGGGGGTRIAPPSF